MFNNFLLSFLIANEHGYKIYVDIRGEQHKERHVRIKYRNKTIGNYELIFDGSKSISELSPMGKSRNLPNSEIKEIKEILSKPENLEKLKRGFEMQEEVVKNNVTFSGPLMMCLTKCVREFKCHFLDNLLKDYNVENIKLYFSKKVWKYENSVDIVTLVINKNDTELRIRIIGECIL